MKAMQRYICETCGTVYADKVKARECGKGHHALERIARVRYAAVHSDSGCPQTLEILMADGKTAVYRRTGER